MKRPTHLIVQDAETDPLRWCWMITLGFALLVCWRLGTPSKIMFDEVHYVPAARQMLRLLPANPEHPLLGKQAIAGAIWLLGDNAVAWRIPSALMGAVGLFAFGRALWWATGRRFATLAGMVLLASDFTWFVQSRIAMLDMVMAGFGMVALWQLAVVAGASNTPRPRWHLALAGISLGLALGAKWSFVPAAVVVCGGLVVARLRASARRQAPMVPGIGLAEMLLWLGLVPLLIYVASFWPAFFYQQGALSPLGLIDWHRHMLQLQASVVAHHPYQSLWWQWAVNWRPIWFLYEVVDGAQRGVLLLGNPFTMLAGLVALGWGVWAGVRRRRHEALWAVALYAASLGLWAVSGKPVQFYYHYLLPGAFLMAALALMLDALWRQQRWWRWGAPAALGLSLVLFGWFLPILAALPLTDGPQSFARWMWLDSWR